MERWVLAVDSRLERFELMQMEWIKYHSYVQMAPDMTTALRYMVKRHFLLVTIAGETVEYMPLLKVMRELGPMPILVLAPKYSAEEKIMAIESGADEYIEWPLTVDERLASARSLIRRYTELNHIPPRQVTTYTHRDLLMAVDFRKVFVKGQEVALSKNDFNLLHLLLKNPGYIYSYTQIYDCLSEEDEGLPGNVVHAVRCQVNRLRRKLRMGRKDVEYIITMRGVGYGLAVEFDRLKSVYQKQN